MTNKDRIIQDQAQRIAGLEEELQQIVVTAAMCQRCKHVAASCERFSPACHPVWRGLQEVRYDPFTGRCEE